MQFVMKRYPVDLLLCILWSCVLVPLCIFEVEDPVRIVLGLPFVLFIPGYVLVAALFPSKKLDRGIDVVERVALSFGLSIAVVPLLGLVLNYTPFGIRLVPVLLSVFGFIVLIGVVAVFRWFRTPVDERFVLAVNVQLPGYSSRVDAVLSVVLVMCIVVALVLLVYVIVLPREGEKFTEFYLLGLEGNASGYPRNLSWNETAGVFVGVVNHEYRVVNYTVEVWLVNESLVYNDSSGENDTVYHHFWFVDSLSVQLNHTPIDLEGVWEPQWEQPFMFQPLQNGSLKLLFLLFDYRVVDSFEKNVDYGSLAAERIAGAYRSAHLWLSVS